MMSDKRNRSLIEEIDVTIAYMLNDSNGTYMSLKYTPNQWHRNNSCRNMLIKTVYRFVVSL